MVNRVADLPLALILAARSDEPDELLTRIALHPSTRVLTPKPLSPAAVAELAGDERAAAIHEATGGNPFYVHALLADEDGTPRPVIDSIALRLDALPPACPALARAIAVAGSGGTIAARLAGLDVRERGRGRRGARARPTSCAATTSRTRSSSRRSTPRSRRRSAPSCTPPPRAWSAAPERVAAQVMAAGPGGGVWAAQALRAAAAAAWARGAPDVAATFLRRAAEEELPRDELVPLLRELARALIATEGPGGLPALREALALAPDDRARGDRPRARPRAVRPGLLHRRRRRCSTRHEARRRGPSSRRSRCSTSRWSAASVGSTRSRSSSRPAPRRVGAWIEVARRPPAAPAPTTPRRRSPSAARPSLAGALVALMAAGRLEQADAIWTGVADSRARARRARDAAARGRAAGDRPAAPGPRRRGRGRPARADRLGRRARPALRRLPDGAAVGDRAARRRADRARRARRGAALGRR